MSSVAVHTIVLYVYRIRRMLKRRKWPIALVSLNRQMNTSEGDRVLVMAATNRPQELDDAALRYVCLHGQLIGVRVHPSSMQAV